ncbi:MAG: hypothetical protein Q4D71_13620, partial [Oscillospiraceae bacterium]|nr:hypothetical protein [Oscillospiraceae bacterium]
MNSNYSFKNEYEIDLKDLIWKFLAQWKAVLLFCIIMALVIPGLKYLIDTKAYDTAVAEKAEAEAADSIPFDERIDEILEVIPAEDAAQIRFILEQQDLIDYQNDYLKSSIFANTDPTSQRNLLIKYQMKKSEGVDMQVLIDGYWACLRRKSTITALRDIIAPDASLEAMYEIINAYGSEITDSEVESMIYTVS